MSDESHALDKFTDRALAIGGKPLAIQSAVAAGSIGLMSATIAVPAEWALWFQWPIWGLFMLSMLGLAYHVLRGFIIPRS